MLDTETGHDTETAQTCRQHTALRSMQHTVLPQKHCTRAHAMAQPSSGSFGVCVQATWDEPRRAGVKRVRPLATDLGIVTVEHLPMDALRAPTLRRTNS